MALPCVTDCEDHISGNFVILHLKKKKNFWFTLLPSSYLSPSLNHKGSAGVGKLFSVKGRTAVFR